MGKRGPRIRRRWSLAALGLAVLASWFLWAPPRLTLEPGALDFGEQRVGTRSATQTVRLGNGGRRQLRLGAIELEGVGAREFAVLAESCAGRALPAGASCSVDLAFAPAGPGERRAELAFGRDERLPLAGVGTAPRLVVEPERLDFGRQAVGQPSAAARVVLRNEGSAALRLDRIAPDGPAASGFQRDEDECSGRSLAPGESCTASWTFRPARVGEATADLIVESDGGEAPTVTLAGIGEAPGLMMTPERLAFGSLRVGRESEPETVLFENTGNAPLALAGLELVGAGRGAFEIVEQDCRATLDPGDNCSAAVRFRPASEGAAAAALRARASGLARQPQVELSGRGTVRRLVARPQRLEFGRVEAGTSARLPVVVESVGGEDTTLRRVAIDGPAAGEFGVEGNCPRGGVIPAGRSCTLDVRFQPSAPGAREATLTLEHDGAGGALSVDLTGGGFTPPRALVEVHPERLDFGRWQVGERSGIEAVRVANAGTAPLGLAGIRLTGADAGDFQLVPASCDGIPYVAPASDCVVGLRFVARATGPRRATLVIRHDAEGGSTAVELSGEGIP